MTYQEWDWTRLKDFRNDGGTKFDSTLDANVFQEVAPEFRRLVNPKELAPQLKMRQILTPTEFEMMNNDVIERMDKNVKLLAVLPSKGLRALDVTYLSLWDSYESVLGDGLHGHYELAMLLWQSLRNQGGVDTGTQLMKWKDPRQIVSKLPSMDLTEDSTISFASNLGIGREDSALQQLRDVKEISQYWLSTNGEECTMEDLVQALLCTRGLGYLVSGIFPPSHSNPPEVYRFIRQLTSFTALASYLGYSDDCMKRIQAPSRYSLRHQWVIFLRMWQVPDCGEDTGKILDEMAASGNLQLTEATLSLGNAGTQGGPNIQLNNLTLVYNYYGNPGSSRGSQGTSMITPDVPGLGSTVQPQLLAASHMHMPQHLPTASPNASNVTADTPVVLQVDGENHGKQPSSPIASPADKQQSKQQLNGHLQDPQQLFPAPKPCSVNEVTSDTSALAQSDQYTEGSARSAEIQVSGMDLLDACMKKDWNLVEDLIKSMKEAGVAPSVYDAKSKDGKTVLIFACINKKRRLVVQLVKNRANVSTADNEGRSPLMYACISGRLDLVKMLVINHADVAAVDCESYTPLLVACTIGEGVPLTVEALLKADANPNGNPKAVLRPLVEASARGHSRVVLCLLENGANPNIQDATGNTALLQACKCSQPNMALLLLDHGVSTNISDYDGTSPLFSAITVNLYTVIQKLIQKGANVNATQGTLSPLGHAVMANCVHIVKYLLENKDLDKSLYGLSSSIIAAVKVENFYCARLLLSELGGAEVALQRAEENGMDQLQEHIRLYMAMSTSLPSQLLEESATSFQVPAHNTKMLSTMQKFCQICVAAAMMNPDDKENLPILAAADGNTELHDFLQKCIQNRQNPQTLRNDFLGGQPSAFQFLVQQNFLTVESFQMQAYAMCDDPQQFWKDLVDIFHQIPGGKALPQDYQTVLQHVFSGNLGIGMGLRRAEASHSLPGLQTQASHSLPGLQSQGTAQDTFTESIVSQRGEPGRASAIAPQGATWQIGDTTSQHDKYQSTSRNPEVASSGKMKVPTDIRRTQVQTVQQDINAQRLKLKPFVKEAVLLPENVLGQGAYGCVIELKVGGKLYAGKKLRADACPDPLKFWNKFYTEYQVLDKLCHKHIVQYRGITVMSDQNSDPPILIMEKLMTNLEKFITSPTLFGIHDPDFQLKLSFLTGIADGLKYLHKSGVIHRDLTARNILLDDNLVAKISDFGNSAIVDIEPSSHLETKSKSCVPGTLLYMPPEACDTEHAYYSEKLDVFSFGHLSLFIITNEPPSSLLPVAFRDKRAPGGLSARSEIDRRIKYMNLLYQKIGRDHLLVTMIIQCLQNFPEDRPSAEDVFTALSQMH